MNLTLFPVQQNYRVTELLLILCFDKKDDKALMTRKKTKIKKKNSHIKTIFKYFFKGSDSKKKLK